MKILKLIKIMFSCVRKNPINLETFPTHFGKDYFYSLHSIFLFEKLSFICMFSMYSFSILKLLSFKNPLLLIGNINNFVLFNDTNVMFQLLHFFFQLLLADLLWQGVDENGQGLELFMHLFPVLF